MITSNAGTYGTAGWMSESQAKKVYEVGPVEDVTGTILGQFTQDGEEVIALPFEPTGNRNLILIGPPGSGKSFGYVRTAVFQSIVRGESVVVTDPKGEIHNDMRKLLESRGYEVKVFNLINLDLSMLGTAYRKSTTLLRAISMTSVSLRSVKPLSRTRAAAVKQTRSGRVLRRICSALPFPTARLCVRLRSLKSMSAVPKNF